jgi:hypothetical protein
MSIIPQLVFTIVLAVAIWLFARKAGDISANIHLGRPEDYSDNKKERWKNLLLLAFGQKKMFRKPIPHH